MKKHKRYKPRKVNMEAIRIDGVMLYAGDSVATVPCPRWLQHRMKFNIRQDARRSQVVFPLRQKAAREMLEDYNIPFLRPKGN